MFSLLLIPMLLHAIQQMVSKLWFDIWYVSEVDPDVVNPYIESFSNSLVGDMFCGLVMVVQV